MAAELEIYEDSAGVQSREVFYTNITGDAILAAYLIPEYVRTWGLAVADTYTIEMEHDGTVWNGTVTPATGLPTEFVLSDTPAVSQGSIIAGVAMDIDELTPGPTYRAEVIVGWHAGTLVAGATGTGHQLWARNIGDVGGTDARVLIRPDATIRNPVGDTVAIGVDETSLELTTPIGVWELTFTGSVGSYTFDVTFNGTPIGEIEGEEDGPQVHVQLPDGPLVVYDLVAIAVGPVEVEVSAGFQDFQLAPDVAGAPGTWAGAEVVLGALDADEAVPFWIRAQSAPGRSAVGNPYTAQLQARIISV